MRGLEPTLREALDRHPGQLVLLCSFQKEESVLVDELVRIAGPGGSLPRIVTIDTGVLFAETLATWRAFEDRFGVQVEVQDAGGDWTGPEHCCGEAKVAALERALAGADAWITGVRREQGAARSGAELVEWDAKRSMHKYNPLAHWTEQDLWRRIHDRALPYHPLHDAGYESIGCAPCTAPGTGREGRWAGTDKTECGLHVVIDPLVIVFGLGVGILVGLTGIGGGSLMTPLLILAVGVKPVVAIGTDLAYGAITKTLGGWRHWRKGTVDLGVSGWMAVGSVPGALIGVWLLERLHHAYGADFEPALLGLVAGALIVVSLAILARALFMPKLVARERHAVELNRRVKATAAGIGLVLGALIGLTSVGSGALIGLALILVFHLTPHRVVGTDVFHAAVLLWTAALAHLASGNVDLLLTANILLGSLPGVWIGTSLITRVPAHGLRPALGCVLLGSALGVLSKAGVDVPVAAIVGIPLAAGVAAWALTVRQRLEVAPV